MMERAKELIQESNVALTQGAIKSSVGFGASVAAMTINDIAALIVAALTAIYMILQIETAWYKRKEAKRSNKKAKHNE